MSQEFLVDVHVIYNDNGEEQLIFLTNERRFTRIFRKHDKLIAVLLGLLAITHKIEDALQTRVAEQRNAPVQSEQDRALFWGCGNCETGNWATNDICANCKAPRPTRSDGG